MWIYLTNIVSKSVNHCYAFISDNTVLLLLCEARLSRRIYECEGADYHATTKCKQEGGLASKGLSLTELTKWEDAGVAHEDIPMVIRQETNVTRS